MTTRPLTRSNYLAQRARKVESQPADLPRPQLRRRIADAVHYGVTTVLGNDGNGACMYYALVGLTLSQHLTGRDYNLQVGSLSVRATQDGMTLVMDAEHPLIPGLEFHAWFGSRWPTGETELVDLSSRHYRTWAESVGMAWDMPNPPPYIWQLNGWPDGIFLKPVKSAMDASTAHILGSGGKEQGLWREMYRLALARC